MHSGIIFSNKIILNTDVPGCFSTPLCLLYMNSGSGFPGFLFASYFYSKYYKSEYGHSQS